MATKAPLYQHDLQDGHGCETVILAAPSKDDVRNILTASLSPHQKADNIKRVCWAEFEVRPNEDEDGVEFVTTLNGAQHIFDSTHPSYPYLQKQFPKQVANIEDYLARRAAGEF